MTEVSAWADKGWGFKVLGIVGGLAGAVVGQYSGVNLLIPLFATGLVWWGGTKVLKDEKKEILPTFAVNAGHFLWIILGAFMLGASAFAGLGLDLAVYAIGLIWLFKKPSFGPLILLGIYQSISLVVNGYSIAAAPIGSASHRALLVHVIWRVIALVLIAKLFVTLGRKSLPSTSEAP
jgi:hypothetical protein